MTISWKDRGVGKRIEGTNGPDVIQGGPNAEEIDAGGGADVICGGDDDDVIRGGPSGDVMYGQGDDDTFFPGTGDDSIDGGANNPVRSEDSPGDLVAFDRAELDDPCDTPAETDFDNPGFADETCSDEFFASLGPGPFDPPHAEGAGGYDLLTGVESLRGTRELFNFLHGDSDPNVLIDGNRGSSLQGEGGNDLLLGNGGPDVLSGDEGDDFLDGGGDEDDAGSDLLNGGDGTDTCVNGNPDFTSDCEAEAGCPVIGRATRSGSGCKARKQVTFKFSVDGFPDHPPEVLLPADLVGVELKTSETRLVTPPPAAGPYDYEAEGKISMTNTYLVEGEGIVERSVAFELRVGSYGRDNEGRPDEERTVTAFGSVIASDDPNCPVGTTAVFNLRVRKGEAVLEMEKTKCLSDEVLLWSKRRHFKSAKVGSPKPLG